MKILPNGYVLYKPRAMFRGSVEDSFTVTLADGKGGVTNVVINVRAFGAIAGTFQGLLSDAVAPALALSNTATETAISEEYRGRITIVLNDRATFSAKLEIDGQVSRFSGALSGALQFEKTLRYHGQSARLLMKYDDLADRWTVSVEGQAINVRDAGNVARMSKSKGIRPARYIAEIYRPDDASSEGGAAVVHVRNNGLAAVVGVLPDGTAFSASSNVDSRGALTLYRWIGSARQASSQAFGGIWQLNSSGEIGSVTGELRWRRSSIDALSSATELLQVGPRGQSADTMAAVAK